MSQSDRAIKKLATDLARLKREVVSWRGAQADYTSIENGGNFTFKDGDGNVTAIVGGQDDGSNTIRHVDGPVPPIPSGLAAHVDGPIVQVSWDGTFEDADEATYDWSHLEVVAVGPSNEQLTATINDVTGASASVAATVSGEWTVVARSVSRAEKRSLDGDAGIVDVELVGLTGAINDAIGSANGKNTVTYAETAPTPADEGIAGDTWFVGSVADIKNPNNLAQNAEFNTLQYQRSDGMAAPSAGTTLELATSWFSSAPTSLKIIPTGSANTTAVDQIMRENPNTAIDAGKTFTIAADIHLDEPQTGSFWTHPRRILVRTRSGGSNNYAFATSSIAPNVAGTSRLKVTFTLPSDLEWWYFLLTNGSSTTPVYWDNLVIEEGTTDGKFWVTNDDGSWNVVEQYRHNGVVWKPVELNHEVIASVDLGKATVGELDGIRIMGQTVRGEQLSGDAIDGKVITGATYRTSGGNGSWSDAGLFIAQPDGTSMVRFPTDGSPLSLTASDTQIERASIGELDVSNGAVRSGGTMTLASGVTAPPSPPELTTGWQKVCTLDTPDSELAYDWLGLGYWSEGSGHWVRAVNVLGSEGDSYDRIEVYDYATGDFQNSILTGLNPRSGVTVIGDVAYVMGPDYQKSNIGKQWVHGFDLNTGERVTRWEFVNFFDPKQAKVALGNDGTNLVAAGVAPNLSLNVFRYNPSTGAQSGSQWSTAQDWPASASKALYGVRVNGNDVGVVTGWGGRVYLNNNNTLVRKTDTENASGYAGWVLPAHDVSGCVWVSGVPYPVDSNGTVYEGSVSASDYTREMCFTWYDGTHETTASPIAAIDVGARETATISLPARTGLQKRLYSRSAGSSGNWSRSVVPADVTVSPAPVGIAVFTPPTNNSFPNAAPAVLKSTNDKFEIKGDGSGHWGPLTFNADGSMSGMRRMAAGRVTIAVTDQQKGYETATVNFPTGRFTSPPAVTVGANSTNTALINVGALSVTAEQATIAVRRTTTTDTIVDWIATEID